MYVVLENFWMGVLTCVVFMVAGYYHTKDPVKLRLMFARSRVGMPIYDPALRKPFMVIIIEDTQEL